MKRKFGRWMLRSVFGLSYQAVDNSSWPDKCILALAPHTSNWDFVIGKSFLWANGVKSNFLIKGFWFFWPFGYLMRAWGGIPVHRKRGAASMTDQLAEVARREPLFRLCITPEGTRKPTSEWKRGFFFIAQKAQIPIIPYGLDFKTRSIIQGEPIIPTPDMTVDEAIARLKEFFKGMQGKNPKNFTV